MKMRDVDSASTAAMPFSCSMSAPLRLEPQPKFRPATMMSPGCTSSTHPGRLLEKQYGAASSSLSFLAKTMCPGIIRSVATLSPNFHTLPLKIVCIEGAPRGIFSGR